MFLNVKLSLKKFEKYLKLFELLFFYFKTQRVQNQIKCIHDKKKL